MEEMSFEQMLEESLSSTSYEIGDIVQGHIVSTNDDIAFVDFSGKSEAVLNIKEISDKDNNITINLENDYDFTIVDNRSGEIKVTLYPGKGYFSSELLKICKDNSIPVYGKISKIKEKGLDVSIDTFTAFCPASQIDIKRINDLSELENQEFAFKIIELSGNGKNIVLSRRVLLEAIKESEKSELKTVLKDGDIIEGTIFRIEDYGIFIKYRSIEGLIHSSELSFSKLIKPANFSIGQKLKAMILQLDWENDKHSFSLKKLESDPWDNISDLTQGAVFDGIVVKNIKGGSIVEIKPGVEGYLPVSRMSYTKKVNSPEEILNENDKIQVKILNIQSSEKKLLLELVSEEGNPWETNSFDESKLKTCVIEKIIPHGFVVRLENGMEGFIPKSEFGDNKSSSEYSLNDKIKAAVIEFSKNDKKLILSIKQADNIEERTEAVKYMNKEKSAQTSGNTLGDMFKDVFNNINEN